MDRQETFQRENQRVPASDILQAMASGQEIKLIACTITGAVDVNRLFVKGEDFDVSSLSSYSDSNLLTVTFDRTLSFKSCVFEDDVCFSALWESTGQLEVIFKRDVFFNMCKSVKKISKWADLPLVIKSALKKQPNENEIVSFVSFLFATSIE